MTEMLGFLRDTHDGAEGHLNSECALSKADVVIIKGDILVKRTDSLFQR
jgi:predicted phosphodiesterase